MQTATLHIADLQLSGTVDGKPIPTRSFSDPQELADAVTQLITGSADDEDDDSDDSTAGSAQAGSVADQASAAPANNAPSYGQSAQSSLAPPSAATLQPPAKRSGAVATHKQMWDAEAAKRQQRNRRALTNLT
jgi:hypothetical protein